MFFNPVVSTRDLVLFIVGMFRAAAKEPIPDEPVIIPNPQESMVVAPALPASKVFPFWVFVTALRTLLRYAFWMSKDVEFVENKEVSIPSGVFWIVKSSNVKDPTP